jgi:protein farnesyltransferase/geranylgeranyltransferase type-1 subunit alpha
LNDKQLEEQELIFLNDLGGDNPKSYQIWHQREALADKVSTKENEIDFINRMLSNDSKNYHAWSYRLL